MTIYSKIKTNWDKLALVLVMALTGFLTFYSIGKEGYSNEYYAAAVKSMLTSWHNFFFASFDAGGYVTVDKPALGLWLQAASAKLFGFHGWSIILPEALSSVVSVALIFHIVKRSFGKAAGIISALVLAITPILIAVSRTNNLDASLIMVLLFATWALIIASERGSLKLLMLSMILVGLGFNIKMLQAFMVLPAFYLVYFFTAPNRITKRVVHLIAATLVLVTVSFSWAVAVDLTSADNRPYVGGSETNSVIELALGYNGIQRLTGNQSMGGSKPMDGLPNSKGSSDSNTQNNGSMPPTPPDLQSTDDNNMPNPPDNQNMDGQDQVRGNASIDGSRPIPPDGNMPNNAMKGQFGHGRPGDDGGFGGGDGGGPGGTQENGQKGIFRIFNKNQAGQISWFLPMALFGLAALCIRLFNKEDNERKTVLRYTILFAGLLIPMIAFFSIAGFYHRYYLSMLAPSIAALSGIGINKLWRFYMGRGWKWVLLPASILTTAAVQILILSRYSDWNRYIIPVVGGVCMFVTAILVIIRLRRKDDLQKTIKASIIAALAALLLAPAIWSYTPIIYGSQVVMPVAGPELKKDFGMGQMKNQSGGDGSDIQFKMNDKMGETSSEMVKFLLDNYNNEKYLVAVSSANSAASIILETGKPVMAVGGFSGTDNILTVERLEQMVKNGEIRFFQLDGNGMGRQSEITEWVKAHGKAVTLSSSATSQNDGMGKFLGGMQGGTLYDLSSN